MFCKTCGKEINDKAVICVHCGCSVVDEKKDPPKKKKKKLPIIVAVLIFLIVMIAAIGSGETEPSTEETKKPVKTTAVTTTVPEEYSDSCPVIVSATIEDNIINVPEISCHIKNNTNKDIEAIQFYFVPLDVYGEEVNSIMATNRFYTDNRISAGTSTTQNYQLLDQTIKTGTLYVYSVYFSDGTEWGDKDASTTYIKKYSEKIAVVE